MLKLKTIFAEIYMYTYRVSTKSVPISYISKMAQKYKKPRNTCSIILRGYSFKMGEIVFPKGCPRKTITQKFQIRFPIL